MGPLGRKVKRLLQRAFPGAQIAIEDDEYGIGGRIISPAFRGVNSRGRVERVHGYLQEHLSPEEERRVVLIAASTPEEAKARASLDEIPNGARRPLRSPGRRP
jgi:hypothetical protein